MNSFVVLGIVGFAIWWVHRNTEKRSHWRKQPWSK
jgi:hypothetical protein